MRQALPYLMGAVMGAAMLGMVHMALTGQSDLGLWAATAFVLAHVAVVAGIVAVPLVAARFVPRLARWLAKVHRPSWAHLRQMLAGASLSVITAHVALHGLL
jgi:hypothetical protein